MIHFKNIQDFLSQESFAVIGVSRTERKFGNAVYRELKKKGFRVFAINPNMETLDNDPCYPSLSALPEKVGGIVTATHPSITERIVREASSLGIRHVWMQQGSQSKEALRYCEGNGMNAVHGECILMFVEPVESIHRFHRFIWRLLGKIPRTTNGKHIPAHSA